MDNVPRRAGRPEVKEASTSRQGQDHEAMETQTFIQIDRRLLGGVRFHLLVVCFPLNR